MNNTIMTADTKIATFSGTALVFLYSIGPGEVIKSCLLAGIAAAVSFTVSLVCKWVWKKMQKFFRWDED